MISSQVMSILNEFRDSKEGDWTADILTRAFAAQFADIVGSVKIETDERDVNASVHPPDTPKLQIEDLSAGFTVTHRYGFMRPGDKGATGGWTSRFRGPNAFIPNKPGDVVAYGPDGAIDFRDYYRRGVGGLLVPIPPGSGEWTLKAIDGVVQWVEDAAGIVVPCCVEPLPTLLTLAWGSEYQAMPELTLAGGEVTLEYDADEDAWLWSGPSPFASCEGAFFNSISVHCDGTDWWLTISSAIGGDGTECEVTVSSCDPFSGTVADDCSSSGCGSFNLRGVTITE